MSDRAAERGGGVSGITDRVQVTSGGVQPARRARPVQAVVAAVRRAVLRDERVRVGRNAVASLRFDRRVRLVVVAQMLRLQRLRQRQLLRVPDACQ